MSKLTVEQRIQKSHVYLMNNPKYCLYSGVFMLGKVDVSDKVQTARTNGRDIEYGREFVSKLTDAELKGLILHENLHKAFRHTTLWKHLYKENPTYANMACDYVINLMIHDSDPTGTDVKLPQGGLLDEKYRGMDSGAVYKLLEKEYGKNGGGNKTQGTIGEGFDEHDWDSADEMSKEEQEALVRDIDQALRQGAILAGKLSGNVPREITEALEPKVDWREVLRDFVSSICVDKDNSTWRRPNRRWVSQDVYMPSLIGEAVGRICIGIDTSGSIGQAEIGQFLGELMSICNHVKPEGIDLLYWDTAVCQHEKYERDEFEALMSSTKPAGGGGTDPACIPKYIDKHKMNPECVIILTDGYVSGWGNWHHPVFWGITSKGINADCGVSVYVGD